MSLSNHQTNQNIHATQKAERLEARISIQQKKLFQHAASLLHSSLTDFIIASLTEASKKVIQDHEFIRLSLADQKVFIEALLNPPTPNKNLKKAVMRYKGKMKLNERRKFSN